MAWGSCLKARGSRLMAHGQKKFALGAPGPPPSATFLFGHEPWALSHEPWDMSHGPWAISYEPLTISNRFISQLFDSTLHDSKTPKFQSFRLSMFQIFKMFKMCVCFRISHCFRKYGARMFQTCRVLRLWDFGNYVSWRWFLDLFDLP